MFINIINNTSDIIYILFYIPFLTSILVSFLNFKYNITLIRILLSFMLFLCIFCLFNERLQVNRVGNNFYSFDSNLYSNWINIIILFVFLLIKMILSFKKEYFTRIDNKYYYSLYLIIIFSFTVICLTRNVITFLTFFLLYICSEYIYKNLM